MKINNKPVAGQNIAEHFAEFFDKKVKTIVNETVVDPGADLGYITVHKKLLLWM